MMVIENMKYMKNHSAFQTLVAAAVVLMSLCCLVFFIQVYSKLQNISKRVDALESNNHAGNLPKQRRRESSSAWLSSRLEQMEIDDRTMYKNYNSMLAIVLAWMKNNSKSIEENRLLLSGFQKQSRRQKRLHDPGKQKTTKDVRTITSAGNEQDILSIFKQDRKYFEISAKPNQSQQEFEDFKVNGIDKTVQIPNDNVQLHYYPSG